MKTFLSLTLSALLLLGCARLDRKEHDIEVKGYRGKLTVYLDQGRVLSYAAEFDGSPVEWLAGTAYGKNNIHNGVPDAQVMTVRCTMGNRERRSMYDKTNGRWESSLKICDVTEEVAALGSGVEQRVAELYGD